MIRTGEGSGVTDDNYGTFLNARARMLLDEIGRLSGTNIMIPADERHDKIGIVENLIRDTIDRQLTDRHGTDYWSPQIINPQVYEYVERLLAQDRQRGITYDTPRQKLNKCTPGHYWDIIRGANWALFRDLFKPEHQARSMMDWLKDYRNATQHYTPMSDEMRRYGEEAIRWFEAKLGHGGASGIT
jgi:hypothetical protein